MGMLNLNDITTIAESLNRPALAITQPRCVRVRNRNASCGRCIDACEAGSLQVVDNALELTLSLCVNCGACAAVCPTEAMLMLEPKRTQLASDLEALRVYYARTRDLQDKPLVIACARQLSRFEGMQERVVGVPCLAHMDVPLLLDAVTKHPAGVLLVDGNCATCKLGWCSERMDAVVGESCALTEAALGGRSSGEMTVKRASQMPSHVQRKTGEEEFDSTKRSFFSNAADEMKLTVLSAARTTLEEKLGGNQKSIAEQLKVKENGSLPQYPMPQHMEALDALDSLEPAPDAQFDSPLFALIDIETERCNACGMCATFCPTGAISRGASLPGTRTVSRLDFLPCDCVACGLCEDVCLKKCLHLRHDVTAEELFSLDPLQFELGANASKRTLPFA